MVANHDVDDEGGRFRYEVETLMDRLWELQLDTRRTLSRLDQIMGTNRTEERPMTPTRVVQGRVPPDDTPPFDPHTLEVGDYIFITNKPRGTNRGRLGVITQVRPRRIDFQLVDGTKTHRAPKNLRKITRQRYDMIYQQQG
jgi:hypothetical protein